MNHGVAFAFPLTITGAVNANFATTGDSTERTLRLDIAPGYTRSAPGAMRRAWAHRGNGKLLGLTFSKIELPGMEDRRRDGACFAQSLLGSSCRIQGTARHGKREQELVDRLRGKCGAHPVFRRFSP